MKIYTKGGDKGTTALFGGKRLPKYDLRIEAYGTIDELNSNLGLLRDHSVDEKTSQELLDIQSELFTLGSILASDPEKSNLKLPEITTDHVNRLEKQIDENETGLPELKNFILPGGNNVVSFCHICRCICRRAERRVVELNDAEGVQDEIIQYLNRLSDYLFVLARKVANDKGVKEILWNPK